MDKRLLNFAHKPLSRERFFLVVAVFLTQCSISAAQWIRATNSPSLNITNVHISGARFCAASLGYGLFTSPDGKSSWTPIPAVGGLVTTLATVDTTLFVGSEYGLVKSADGGASWSNANSSGIFVISTPICMASEKPSLFVGTFFFGIYQTDNLGSSWTKPDTGLPLILYTYSLALSGQTLYAGTSAGVYQSTDKATTWHSANGGLPDSTDMLEILIAGTTVFGCGSKGVFRSTVQQTTWTSINAGLPSTFALDMILKDSRLFVALGDSGVYYSSNNGDSWIAWSSGLDTNGVNVLAASETDIWAGTRNGVWYRPISQMVVSAPLLENTAIADDIVLEQNYPNPFNPRTRIGFSLRVSGPVTMRIYNTLGMVVATLVNESLSAGRYEVDWNADCPTGVYFCRVEQGSFIKTRKLVLIK